MNAKPTVHMNTLVQSSCKIRTRKRLHKAIFDTDAGKSVMLIAYHSKTLLLSNYIRLSTANNTELINKWFTLITFRLGERKFTLTFIVVEQLSAAFPIGFDFDTLYKVGLYYDGEGKSYLKICDEHVELVSTNLVNSQVRLMNEQIIQPYYNVVCNPRLRQSQ